MKYNEMCRGSSHDTMSNPYEVCKNMNRGEKNQSKERRMLLKWVLKKRDVVDWIKMAVEMDDWGGH